MVVGGVRALEIFLEEIRSQAVLEKERHLSFLKRETFDPGSDCSSAAGFNKPQVQRRGPPATAPASPRQSL